MLGLFGAEVGSCVRCCEPPSRRRKLGMGWRAGSLRGALVGGGVGAGDGEVEGGGEGMVRPSSSSRDGGGL